MKKFKKYRAPLLIVLTILGLMFALFVPLPYYVESPGTAEDIRQVLKVNGKEDEAAGSYNYVTVMVGQTSLAGLAVAALNDDMTIRSAKEMTGGANSEDYWRISQYYIETSKNMAEYQALTLAEQDVTLKYIGVYVIQLAEDSTFKGILNIADTVTGVNGETFENSAAMIAYVAGLKVGDKVTVQYNSEGESKEAEGQIIKLGNGKNGIGISLVDHTEVESSTDIAWSTEGVGGPSAGLMFTLAIYTQVAEPDLRAGRVIAGTGTIEQDGSVGDIGGVDKKVVSAANAGAEIFFVPNNPVDKAVKKANPKAMTNYEEAVKSAKKHKLDIKIVPVKNVQEAIDYLRNN